MAAPAQLRSWAPCSCIATMRAFASPTHSHTKSCRPRTPYRLVEPLSTGASLDRVMYLLTTFEREAESTAATYSHSASVGRRWPRARQKFRASTQLMSVTGACGFDAALP